jgi:myo-inositol-1(or 4)-monophosphatase
MTDATRRAAVAERAARAGGVLARESFRGDLSIETKNGDPTDLVTAVDRDAQRQVISTIREAFPEDALVCEEDSQPVEGPAGESAPDLDLRETLPESGHAWVVDPIDGTANYVRGLSIWTTTVVAVSGDQAVGSATYLPVLGDIYTAGPESATRNGTSMTVSERADPTTFATALIGRWPSRGHDGYTDLFETTAERFGDVRRFGSMQATLALVASGGLDAAFMPTTPKPWDAIAGVHLIRRAGGTATTVEGERWTPDGPGLVVSNDACHDAVLETVRQGASVEVAD